MTQICEDLWEPKDTSWLISGPACYDLFVESVELLWRVPPEPGDYYPIKGDYRVRFGALVGRTDDVNATLDQWALSRWFADRVHPWIMLYSPDNPDTRWQGLSLRVCRPLLMHCGPRVISADGRRARVENVRLESDEAAWVPFTVDELISDGA